MADRKNWEMNETQKKFVEVLGKYPDGITLLEIKLNGDGEFKTGSINVLTSKGIVVADGEREFACDIVYNGSVVGKTKKSGKIYRLA